MFEKPRRGRQARDFNTSVPKILVLKSSSEQIFSRKLPLGAPDLRKHEKRHAQKRSYKRKGNESSFKRIFCKRKRGGSRSLNINTGLADNPLTQSETGQSGMVDLQSAIIEKHSCWICQEEMDTEALLLQHYENHMRHACT